MERRAVSRQPRHRRTTSRLWLPTWDFGLASSDLSPATWNVELPTFFPSQRHPQLRAQLIECLRDRGGDAV